MTTTTMPGANVGGRTFHSFFGIGDGRGTVEELLSRIPGPAKRRIQRLRILMLDEIGMMPPEVFQKASVLAATIKKNTKPFGGIQVIRVVWGV